MMVKVVKFWIVHATYVNDTCFRVNQIAFGWLSPVNRSAVDVGEQTAGQEVVFVGAARVGHDQMNCHAVDLCQLKEGGVFLRRHKRQAKSIEDNLKLVRDDSGDSRQAADRRIKTTKHNIGT